MARNRRADRADWPPNLYEKRPGYYVWRHPKTMEVRGIGRNLEEAKQQAVEANLQVAWSTPLPARLSAMAALSCLHLHTIVRNSAPIDETLAGIYLLLRDSAVVYVGQSLSAYGRVRQHQLEGTKAFDRFTVIRCPVSALDALERAYIAKFQPEYNRTPGGRFSASVMGQMCPLTGEPA